MEPVTEAILLSWDLDPWLILPLLAVAAIYWRGWSLLRRKLPHRFEFFHLACFQSGLIVLLIATVSPVESFAGLLLSVHMIQHVLLTMAAPPLLLLGAPLLPLLRGLPRFTVAGAVRPMLRARALRDLGQFLVRPLVGFILFSLATVVWHVPALYELALRSEFWHGVEHSCFFGTGLLFWWPVVQPWPSRPRWSRWAMIPYLLGADLVNTAVSAVLCFAERVLYPTYAAVPILWGISALADQSAAGAIMWVAGSVAFLLPVGWILPRLLEPSLRAVPLESPTRADEATHRVWPLKSMRRRFILLPLVLICAQLFEPDRALPHPMSVVQFSHATAGYVVSVFSGSMPITAGSVELGVLVQTRAGEPVLDADVDFELQRNGEEPLRAVATRSESSNKLMYGAELPLLTPGRWQVAVRVRHETQINRVTGKLDVEVARNRHPVWLYWLVSSGALATGWLAWRRHRSTYSLSTDASSGSRPQG